MPILNPSLGWERLESIFYRNRTCFENLQWSYNDKPIDLSNFNISIGPFASIIAIYPKQNLNSMLSNFIQIYSGSGLELFKIPWINSKNGKIISVGWNLNCELIIVMDNGNYRKYYNYEGDFEEFNIFEDENEINNEIVDVKFHKFGFAARTSNNTFIYISDYANPLPLKLSQLSTIDSIDPIHINTWNISPPVDISSEITIIVATSFGLCNLNSNTIIPAFQQKDLSSVVFIASPPNDDFLAVFTSSPKPTLLILSSSLSKILTKTACPVNSYPNSMSWCSNDAVILSYDDTLLLVGPSQETLTFYTDSKTYLHSELDGLFFLTSNKLNFISRVSKVTEQTFKIGSTSASAILLDAIDLIDHHSPKANENLEIVNNNLTIAVDNCIRASIEEFDPYWQKKLLRAASFGKTNLELYNPDEFVESCNILKILNFLRNEEIGIFLTFSQFQYLSPLKLINLLLLRNLHYLALKISDFLNLPNYKIYENWACCKIKNALNINDNELLNLIIKKLSQNKKINYINVAKIAFQEGRIALCLNLLDFEVDTSKSIPLLIEMNEENYALLKSNDDLDVDSIVLILIGLYEKLSTVEFFKLLNDKSNSIGIFKTIVSNLDHNKLLYNYYYQDDDIIGLTELEMEKLNNNIYDENKSNFDLKKESLNKSIKLLSRSKFFEIEKQKLKDDLKILEFQKKLFDESNNPNNNTMNESILESISKLIPIDLKKSVKLYKEFKISDKQFYYKVLKTLSLIPEKRNELFEFSQSKKSPIGYQPFFIELKKVGDKRQAALYLPQCTDMTYKEKCKCYLDCDDFKSAINEASKQKDIKLLNDLRPYITNTIHMHYLEDELENITGSRR